MNEAPIVKLLPFSTPAISVKKWYCHLFSHCTVKQVPVSSDCSCLIISLCTIFITTCNELFENMMPFNGDKIRPRLTVRMGNNTFSWLFDTD
jgi:hypothetical protein